MSFARGPLAISLISSVGPLPRELMPRMLSCGWAAGIWMKFVAYQGGLGLIQCLWRNGPSAVWLSVRALNELVRPQSVNSKIFFLGVYHQRRASKSYGRSGG